MRSNIEYDRPDRFSRSSQSTKSISSKASKRPTDLSLLHSGAEIV